MTEHMAGFVREQGILFPDTFDEYVSEENPVRFIDAFVDSPLQRGVVQSSENELINVLVQTKSCTKICALG